MNKTPEEILDLFEEITTAQHLWNNERAMITKKQGVIGVNEMTMVTAKLDALAHELKKMNVNALSTSSNCGLCQGDHGTNECILMQNMENANYVQNRGNSYGNTYNSSWRNHPNFSKKNQRELKSRERV